MLSFPEDEEFTFPPLDDSPEATDEAPYLVTALLVRISTTGPNKRVKAFSPRVATRSRPDTARTVAALGAELRRASSADPRRKMNPVSYASAE